MRSDGRSLVVYIPLMNSIAPKIIGNLRMSSAPAPGSSTAMNPSDQLCKAWRCVDTSHHGCHSVNLVDSLVVHRPIWDAELCVDSRILSVWSSQVVNSDMRELRKRSHSFAHKGRWESRKEGASAGRREEEEEETHDSNDNGRGVYM